MKYLIFTSIMLLSLNVFATDVHSKEGRDALFNVVLEADVNFRYMDKAFDELPSRQWLAFFCDANERTLQELRNAKLTGSDALGQADSILADSFSYGECISNSDTFETIPSGKTADDVYEKMRRSQFDARKLLAHLAKELYEVAVNQSERNESPENAGENQTESAQANSASQE